MRIAMFILLFLVMAGIGHLGAVFITPVFAPGSAFARLSAHAETHAMTFLPEEASANLPLSDAATALALCRYDLSSGPLRIRAPLSETFLVVAFMDARRGIFASVSDRAATGGVLDVVLATRGQLDRIAALDEQGEAIEEIRLEAPSLRGLASVKVVVDRPSARQNAETALRQARCQSESLPE